MKKYLLLCVFLVNTDFFSQAQTKLFVYFVSHNEDNIGYLNGNGGYLSYESARSALISFANLIQSKNAKWNFGSDHVCLRAVAQYDTGASTINTNNKNLVRWLKEDRGVECDPHTHEATYNYADVAYLMQQLGVTPTNTMSGFLYNQLQNGHSWEDYQDGVLGDSFTTFHWYPEILWGAATPNHLDDPEYYGVYKPKSMAEFTLHEPTNHLILCGTGCKLKISDTSTVAYIFSQIKRITDAIQDGTVPADGIYTQEIMFSESVADQIFFLPFVTSLIDSINVLVADEKVEWRNIASIIDYWKNDFNSQPFAMDCDFTVLLEPSAVTEINSKEDFEIFPNPTEDQLQITVSDLFVGNEILITNINGQLIMKEKITSNKIEIPVSNCSEGIYFISVANSIKKSLKQ